MPSKIDERKKALINEIISLMENQTVEELEKQKDFLHGVRFAKEYALKKGA